MPHINANIGSGFKKQGFWYQRIFLPVDISFKTGVKNENQRILQNLSNFPSGCICENQKYAAELEGHISKDKGNVTDLDPFAVNLLKPKKASYKALDERNYYLFKKNKEIVSENERFKAERDELASKMSDYEAVIEYLKKENKEYADSVTLLTQECERYKKDCEDAKALYKVMESEFDKEKAELTAEIKETEFGRKLLASTVSDQCKKLEEKDNRIHQLYKKSDEQEDTIERLNKQLSIMTEKYNRAEKQIAELQEEKRQAEELLAEMQSADKSNASKQNNIFKHIFGQDKK